MIYEAKCLNMMRVDGNPRYLIHYNGWNKRYDEWVNYDRLLEANPDNMAKMRLKKLK